MFILPPEVEELSLINKSSYPSVSEAEVKAYTSKDEKHLTKDKIQEILYRENLL
jgi:hypothetical protein